MYKIKSKVLATKNVRIEGVDKSRMERRLKDVQKYDKNAKIVRVVVR